MGKYKKSIVAFLDILGFKRIIGQSDFENVFQIFQSIITGDKANLALYRAVPLYENESEIPPDEAILYRYNDALEAAQIDIMSDSIVVSTPAINPEALAVVIDICSVIQEMLLELENPILLRGAISVADFYSDGRLIFGKALVDAYLAQEQYAVYPRIIISNEVTIGRRVSIDTNADLPKDSDRYYRVDCLERFLCINQAKNWDEIEESEQYQKIKDLIDINLNGYSDDHIRQKYLWLEKTLENIQASFKGEV